MPIPEAPRDPAPEPSPVPPSDFGPHPPAGTPPAPTPAPEPVYVPPFVTSHVRVTQPGEYDMNFPGTMSIAILGPVKVNWVAHGPSHYNRGSVGVEVDGVKLEGVAGLYSGVYEVSGQTSIKFTTGKQHLMRVRVAHA